MEYPQKSLTIHLYRYEEVVSSLIWCIIQRKYTESVFWALELYDSGMMDGIFQKLQEAWLLYAGFGPNCYSVLLQMNDSEIDRDDLVKTLYMWSRVTPDATVAQLLIRGSVTPTNWTVRFPHSSVYQTVEMAIHDCLKRGKALEAWTLSRAMSPKDKWDIIYKQIPNNSYRDSITKTIQSLDISEHVRLATCFVLAAIPDAILKASIAELKPVTIPSELLTTVSDWDEENSMRKRRCLAIRPEAITYTCERSSLPMKESALMDIHYNLEANLRDSYCWQIILDDYMEHGQWKSDTYKEMFYNTYFSYPSDDIPDEWPSKDKELSHGRGLGKTTEVALRQHLSYMLRNKTCLGAYICGITPPTGMPPTLQWDDLYANLEGDCSKFLESQLPFTSIAKRFEVV